MRTVKKTNFFAALLVLSALAPLTAYAVQTDPFSQDPGVIVPGGQGPVTPGGAGGSTNRNFVPCEKDPVGCGFKEVYQLIKTIIDFLLLDILSPVAIIAILFAGFKYVTAQGNPGEIKKAHDIFYYVVIGMVIAFAAWLIVNTILSTLSGEPGSLYNFLKK